MIADGRLFVATKEDHTVHALDAGSGTKLWQFAAGGRVDSAPTFYLGTILFGSRDGYVYCLTADEGELVWRFRAAAVDRRCVVYDQLESVWPVHGSVLVHEDVLWFCAGRSSFLDGGLLVYRLNPRTGKMLSTTTIDTLGDNDEQPPITPTIFARLDMEGAKNDVLSCDGSNVFMRHWAFDLKGNSVQQDIDHLFSPTGFLDTSWFRRTYWIYGRTYVSGAQGWARSGNVRPTGRIMSIDQDRLYGFGRDYYPPSPGNQHQMYLAGEAERLFAATRNDTAIALDGDSAAPRKRPQAGSRKGVLWSTPGDLQVRGMVLAGDGEDKRLCVAGAKGDWVISEDAYNGKMGSVLRVFSIGDGNLIADHDLPGLPVFDGMSAARGRLYISLVDGRVVCLGADTTTTEDD
jgi:outer membrane protein assembly factor BamB